MEEYKGLEDEEDVSRYWMNFRKRIMEIERGSATSHCVETSLWKGLWTGEADYGINR